MTTAIAKKQNGDSSVSFGTVVDNIFQNSLRHFFDDNFWNDRGSLASGWGMIAEEIMPLPPAGQRRL